MLSQLRTLWTVFQHTFMRNETVQYPEEMPYQAPRYRGRIVLTPGPGRGGALRGLQSCARWPAPVDCIALQKTRARGGRTLAARVFSHQLFPLHHVRHGARRLAPPTPFN